MTDKTFYITSTLPYVNADLHLGHAMELIRADVIARYKKLSGYEVFFNSGTDEHGMKIAESAAKAGKTPQAYVDEYAEKFKNYVHAFGLDTEVLRLIRTTDAKHITAAQAFWKKVADNGFIYKKNYKRKYCVSCEEEKNESELVDGKCPIHPNRELELIDEENYFFKYSAFQDKLLEFYKNNPDFVIPEIRMREVVSFVQGGLQDFSISRLKSKMPWGIEVPGDTEHVMYVWFDALVDYISTLNWPDIEGDFAKFWLKGTPVQYCGKDNTRFQAIMWQAMLMAAEIPNSHHVIVNGFVLGEGGVKMSKSLGNTVDPMEIVNEYGTDALRYFVLREISSFEDSPVAKDRVKDAYNSGLANGLGNLVSRITTLSEKYLDKKIVNMIVQDVEIKPFNSFVANDFEVFDINMVCKFIWTNISVLDKRISDEQVFKVIKIDLEKGKDILRDYIDKLADIACHLKAIIPTTSQKILDILKENKKPETPLFARKD